MAATVESPTLRRVERTFRRGGRREFGAAWAALTRRGLPIVERVAGDRPHCRVTFVWRPERTVSSPTIYTTIVDVFGGEERLLPLGRTGLWYRSVLLSRAARASYAFSPRPLPGMEAAGSEWTEYLRTTTRDPFNARQIVFPKDPEDPKDAEMTFSVVDLPRAPRQSWARDRGQPRWTEEAYRFHSRIFRDDRWVWTCLPEGFRPGSGPGNLLIVFDGEVYRTTIPTPRIVQNLTSAGRLAPTVVVLLASGPKGRAVELGNNPALPDYLARELLPWLRRRYGVAVPGTRTVLAGSSLGGLAAAFVAKRYPRQFGHVLAQSGAFLWGGGSRAEEPGTLIREYARDPKLPVRFYLDCGTRETLVPPGWGASLQAGARHFRDVLLAKGYPVSYAEFEGGHDYACWRGTLADGLLALLGTARGAPGRHRPRPSRARGAR